MKVGILTWSKAVNHGAILQAYSLQKILEMHSCNVVELDYHYSNNDEIIDKKRKYKKILKKLNINGILSKLKLEKWNENKKEKFNIFRESEMHFGKMYNIELDLDKVVIGSDMVFDFYEGYNPYMYGKDVNCDYIFSYAACFGYTTEKLFNSYKYKDEINMYLKKLKGISYRDDNTGNILKSCCNINNCVKLIDPVLLYGFNEEKKEWNKYGWSTKKYLLIYSYTYNMDSPKEIKTIKKYASDNNLEIVSVGYYHSWCDKSINADPKEFVELFVNAECVITDTFHGSVFSIIFNKQFLPIIRNNSFKIMDLLNELNLSNIVCNDIEKDINLLHKKLNYSQVNSKLRDLRKKSLNYLMNHISN